MYKRVGLFLETEKVEKLKNLPELKNRSFSGFIRDLIEKYLRERKSKKSINEL